MKNQKSLKNYSQQSRSETPNKKQNADIKPLDRIVKLRNDLCYKLMVFLGFEYMGGNKWKI